MTRARRLLAVLFAAAVVEACLHASPCRQPVQGAGRGDWHPDGFWHGRRGASGVHKGIDIPASRIPRSNRPGCTCPPPISRYRHES